MRTLTAKTKALNKVRSLLAIPAADRILSMCSVGKSDKSSFVRVLPNHYQYKVGSWRNVVRDGLKMRLDISNIVDWYMYFGLAEHARMNLYKLIKPRAVVYDIGANIGDVTMHASRIVGESGHIISFEPFPATLKRLYEHVRMNELKNVRVFPVALGAAEDSFFMEEYEHNPGMNRIVTGTDIRSASVKVDVKVLDSLFVTENLPVPEVIKIDVEGFEMEVLRGAASTIRRYKPAIFLELSDNNLRVQNSSSRELLDFLEREGYSCTRADNDCPVTSADDLRHSHFDIIAIA